LFADNRVFPVWINHIDDDCRLMDAPAVNREERPEQQPKPVASHLPWLEVRCVVILVHNA
jgi:hypothetical protein